MKWKPPSENSIDFKLVLRFPPTRNQPDKPDFHAKPIFLLHVWCGDDRGIPKYEQYDEMYVDDEEWEKYVVIFACSSLSYNGAKVPSPHPLDMFD